MSGETPISNSSNQNTINHSDPLYLHASDHPGLLLVSKHFDGSHYNSWNKAISIALSAKNKLGFINGKIPKPDSYDPNLGSMAEMQRYGYIMASQRYFYRHY